MAWYLKFPADTGSSGTNNWGLQVSGIWSGGGGAWVTIGIEFAENVTYPTNRSVYLFDGRRVTDSVSTGSGGYLLSNASNTIEVNGLGSAKLDGVASNTSAWRAALAGQTYSVLMFVGSAANESVMVGARFSNSDGLPNLAIKKVIVTDLNGTHTLDMSASNGTATEFTSDTGTLTARLVNMTSANYVFYNSITANIPSNTLGAALNQPCAINLNNYFTGATSYAIQSGSLPTGLSISGNQIVGTPTSAESTTLVIRASNSIDLLDSATITFNTGLWYLNNASGGDSRIGIPSVTIGATVGDYIEIKAIANAGNPSNQYRLIGQSNSTFTNGIELTSTSVIFRANNVRTDFTSGWALPAVGTAFTVRFVRTSATTWDAFRNGVSLGSVTNANNLTAITVIGSTWTGEAFRGGIYHVDISTNGGVSSTRYYDPSASGGVGNLLIDRVSNQNGTQAGTWPSNDSEWVSYAPAGGGEIEEHFGIFTAAASIARALSSEKQGIGSYDSSILANSSWIVEPSSYASFSTSYTVNKSIVSSKEISSTKPNQSLVAGKTFTQSKEATVSKPNQSLFTGTSLTQSKQAIVNKPSQSLLVATGFTQAKEVNVAKPTTFLNESAAFIWEIVYGIGGNFASVMQLTKTVNSNKEASSSTSSSLLVAGSVAATKEIVTAFATGMQSGFSGVSSEKQAVSNIYAEMVSSFTISSTSKESGGYFATAMRIDDSLFGGTDKAGRPRIITYSTNVLSKRFYQTSATITRIV